MLKTKQCNTVLITGAARRIGKAIAQACIRRDMRIIIHYHQSETEAHLLAKACNVEKPNSVAMIVQADLRDEKALATLCDKIIQSGLPLDGLINNASSFYPTPFGETTYQQWADLMNSNVRAAFFLSQHLAPLLKANRGVVINITDYFAENPLIHHSVYSIAKAAWRAMTQSLAKEMAPNVRVNAVAPGAVLLPENAHADLQESLLNPERRCALNRIGCPNDIASAVLFMMDCQYSTGETLHVDGGRIGIQE